MFTSSVLNNSFRMADSPLGGGGLHLNALNGSSNVLGYNHDNSPASRRENGCTFTSSPSDTNAYGGLFGVSLSENHPYRPVDTGRSFHERSSSRNRKLSTSSSSPTREESGFYKMKHKIDMDEKTFSSSSPPPPREESDYYRMRYPIGRGDTGTDSPLGMRRFSLNIDTDRISTHAQCGSDLSLSLEDISSSRSTSDDTTHLATSSAAVSSSNKRHRRSSRAKSGSREGSKEDGLDMARLSITQVDIDTQDLTSSNTSRHSGHHTSHGRRGRRLTTDGNIPAIVCDTSRGIKMLEKIKDIKKSDHSSKSKQHKGSNSSRDKSPRPPSASHHVTIPHMTSSSAATTTSSKRDPKKRLTKSAFSRHSVD